MDDIILRELSLNDIKDNLLDKFNRYQEVKKRWENKNGNWTLIDGRYIEDWDAEKKAARTKFFAELLKGKDGNIFGAYENDYLIGFAVLTNGKFGSKNQYIQLKYMHVSFGHRHKGIGKKLFEQCIEKARETGAEKIYISANDSEDTQRFYLGVGCKDAMEIDAESAEKEPLDRQMEYVIRNPVDTIGKAARSC